MATFRSFCAAPAPGRGARGGRGPVPLAGHARRTGSRCCSSGSTTSRCARHEIRGNPAPLLASFVARIDRLKDEMVSAEDYRAYAERLMARGRRATPPAPTPRASSSSPRLYADHDRLLAERGALDFGDLVLRAFRLLHERPHVRERVARRFRHVLVDEYQDTNFAQGMLLRLLIEDAPAT